jgi:hypothetical protein
MSEDRHLREKVREIMRAGRMPDRAPDHVWGGPGTGAECAVCGAYTTHAEVELEIEFTQPDGRRASSYLVHLRCYSMLELERQSRAAEPRSARNQAPTAVMVSRAGAQGPTEW